MEDTNEQQTQTRVETNKALYKDFLEGNLPPELKTYFKDLNAHLKDKIGERFVELVPLGSVKGGWAVRKLFGNQTTYSDVDMGVIVNEKSEDDFFAGADTAQEVFKEVQSYSATQHPGVKICGMVNPSLVYINLEQMDFEIDNALKHVREISQSGRAESLPLTLNLLGTALPFLSSNPDIVRKTETEFLKKYTQKELDEIKAGLLGVTSRLGPKHLHEVGEENIKDPRSLHISERMSRLRREWRIKHQ